MNCTSPPTNIPPGSIVRVVADGTIATLHPAIAGEYCTLVHDDLVLGRGPWPMRRDQVELATEDERTEYLARCEAVAP